MYGLEKTIDLSFLAKRRLEQIRIGEYQIELCFDSGIAIAVQGAVTYEGERREDLPSVGKELVNILGGEVVKAERVGRGDLRIVFSSGRSVIIHDSNESYESYTIRGPDCLIVV